MFLIMEPWMLTLTCVLLHAKYNLETRDSEPSQRAEKSLFIKKHFLGFRAIKETQLLCWESTFHHVSRRSLVCVYRTIDGKIFKKKRQKIVQDRMHLRTCSTQTQARAARARPRCAQQLWHLIKSGVGPKPDGGKHR